MINARELRIGNYVNVPRKDQSPFRIDCFEYLFEDDYKVAMNMGTYKVDDVIGEMPLHPLTWNKKDLEPIPLSTDILERCGFENKSKGYFEFGNYCLIQTHEWHFDYSHDELRSDRAIAYPCYLHQLQNLYYALTGEELKINL